mgnify:CR=1 FL=1
MAQTDEYYVYKDDGFWYVKDDTQRILFEGRTRIECLDYLKSLGKVISAKTTVIVERTISAASK